MPPRFACPPRLIVGAVTALALIGCENHSPAEASASASPASQTRTTKMNTPSADDFSRFTLNTTSVLGVHLNRTLALTVTVRDNYDSEAKRRGARSNTDGQFLLGLRAAY